jgi:4'-phosphopantetheinyl transferase
MAEQVQTKGSIGPEAFAACRMPLQALDLPAPSEIHIWYLELEQLAGSLRGALGDEHHAQEPFTRGQLRFARRFYLRLLLGAYLEIPGKSVVINRKNRGKPVLDASVHPVDLHFSMAKSEHRLLIGFSTSAYLGVDLEPAGRRARNALGVARRYFTPGESAALEALPPQERDAAFLRAWACKEAVVKASGLGIANQLCRFSVEIDVERPPGVLEFDGEKTADWTLVVLQPNNDYLGAVSAHEPAMKIRAFRLLPAVSMAA